MKLTKDELIDLLDELTSAIGSIIANQAHLTEDTLAKSYIQSSQQKLQKIKAELSREKERQAELKRRARRKETLEKLRRDNHKPPKVTEASTDGKITTANGKSLGWVKTLSPSHRVFIAANGQIVAIERGNTTYDNRGRFVGYGKQGACLLRRF